MGFIKWVFSKLLYRKLISDKAFMGKLAAVDKAKLKHIKTLDEMMSTGEPVAENMAKTIGILNWESVKGEEGEGIIDIPLKVKYDYVWDKKLKLFAPRDKSKRPKSKYTKAMIEDTHALGEAFTWASSYPDVTKK